MDKASESTVFFCLRGSLVQAFLERVVCLAAGNNNIMSVVSGQWQGEMEEDPSYVRWKYDFFTLFPL